MIGVCDWCSDGEEGLPKARTKALQGSQWSRALLDTHHSKVFAELPVSLSPLISAHFSSLFCLSYV